jgi:hypothetical protein
MMSDKHIRFDEFEDVLASVELVALLAPFVREQPQYWKWIIVGAHSALQGAMVCAYVDGSGTSILKKKPRGKKRASVGKSTSIKSFPRVLRARISRLSASIGSAGRQCLTLNFGPTQQATGERKRTRTFQLKRRTSQLGRP